MAGDRPLWLGLVLYLAVTVAPTLVLWTVLWARSRVVSRRPPPARPAGPPLGSLLADLRRLRRSVRAGGQPNRVRRVALVAAYDDVLVEVCRAVGVDTGPLRAAPRPGPERAFARLQVEAALEAAGVALDPPEPRAAA